ncbi:hypothetical protein ABEX25_13785 [Paenibacillus thiaminolyticus]|uniref:hypothetical protein n=1 Tax=Paenibacillus thiaminolyticus TaxID=49283 RepID=UPI003D2CB9EF
MHSTSSNIEDHRIPNNRNNSSIPANRLQENNLCVPLIFSLPVQTSIIQHMTSLFSMIRFPLNKTAHHCHCDALRFKASDFLRAVAGKLIGSDRTPSHERPKGLFLAVMKRQVIIMPYFDKRPIVRRQEAHFIAGTIIPEQHSSACPSFSYKAS